MSKFRVLLPIFLGTAMMSGCVSSEFVERRNTLLQCDGFGVPYDNADAITVPNTGWSNTPESLARMEGLVGNVESCDAALAYLRTNFPQHRIREISLLQSRAIHHINTGSYSLANADLDAAEAILDADIADQHVQRSIGLNSRFVRAYARQHSGDSAEAERLAMDALEIRPLVRRTGLAAVSIIQFGQSDDTTDALFLQASRISPNLSGLYFEFLIDSGRYEDALRIADELAPAYPVLDIDRYWRTEIQRAENERIIAARFWVDVRGREALAYAGTARVDEARAKLAEAEQEIANGLIELPPLDEDASRRRETRHQIQLAANESVERIGQSHLAYWTNLVEARIATDAGDHDTAMALLRETQLTLSPRAMLRILEDLSGLEPTDRAPSDQSGKSGSGGLLQVHDFLFDADTQARADSTLDALSGLFMGRDHRSRGGCEEEALDNGLEIICFKGINSTPAMTEEMALLRVAERAAQLDAAGFIIERRMDISHIMVGVIPPTPTPETILTVRFLDAAETASCWRCLATEEVIAELQPVFGFARGDSR